MTIKSTIRSMVERTFDTLGYDFIIGKRPEKDMAYVDKNQWEPFKNGDPLLDLYRKAMRLTDMESSNTTVRELRFHTLQQLIKAVLQNNVAGDFAECGCWKGMSAYITCHYIKQSASERQFHIFDSFEGGLSDKINEDRDNNTVALADETSEKNYFSSTEAQLQKALSGFDFYTLNKGWIPERFPEFTDYQFAFANIDVDLYQPTKDSFEFFFPRLSSGGMIYCDDYNATFFPGAKKAIDECVAEYRDEIQIFYEVPLNAMYVIKK